MSSSYSITSKPLVLDGQGKEYILTIRDLPLEEKPREKLLQNGPAILSSVELLAVVLGQGTKKEEVLAMSNRIVREYGESNIFNENDPQKLATDLDIPIVKAMQIVSVGELGRRFFVKEKNGSTIIRTAHDVFDYVADMRNLSKEHLRGIYLNAHYQVVHDEVISIGTVDANIVHPREVFRPALACSATAIILVHNHPSGNLLPSKEDVEVTRQIHEAGNLLGIQLVDHVVVTKESFVSVNITT